jgi:phage protein D
MNVPPVGPLNPLVEGKMRRVVIDTHAHLPDMFEITFHDQAGGALAMSLIDIGTSIQIQGGAAGSPDAPTLITGEVTAIECEIRGGVTYTTVRGYDKSHRLQRVKRTFVYRNMKDSDIAQRMMMNYMLMPTMGPPMIDTTDGVHDAIAQFNQTDWEFLSSRAAENGFDFGVVQGTLYFRKPPKAGDGKIFGLIELPGGPPTLKGGEDLYLFRPRITGTGQVPDVMVRGWDPEQKKAIVGKASSETSQVSLDYSDAAGDLFGKFFLPPRIPDIPIPVLIPGTGASIDYGVKEALPTSVNGDVYTIVDRAVSNANAANGMAKSVAEHLASTWAEAEGTCKGNPYVQAGVSINVENVPGYFTGSWVVTHARHIYDQDDPHQSYLTHFVVSGRQDRSLLGLASMGASNAGAADPPRINGVVPAICVDNNDPNKKGRVRIALPWLADNYVSDWCRVMMPGMGQRGGWMLLPEPDDEVLVAFEFGDIRRPYVIGGLSCPKDSKKVPIPKVAMGIVGERGFHSRDGHKLVFTEDTTPDPTGDIPNAKTGMLVESKDGKLRFNLDMSEMPPTNKKIEIEVNGPAGGCKVTMDAQGAMAIEATGPTGKIDIKAMDVTIEGTKSLTIKSPMPTIDGTGPTAIKGKPIQLN